MKRILVAYMSKTGNTEKMAENIAEGIRLSGNEADLKKISALKKAEELKNYDGYVFGSPTYYRNMTGDMQTFLFLAEKAGLSGKLGGAFGSYMHSGEAARMIYDTMGNVFGMDMVKVGPLELKAPDVFSDEGVKKCLNYGKAFEERSGKVTMRGNPLTLEGMELVVGDAAPDVELADNDLNPVKIASYRGKVCIISSVPSLDTPVCDMETRRFNEEAGKLGEDVVILTVSEDLPFAQKRWCGAAGVDKVITLSDYKDRSFGEKYGVLIKELKLLARCVFVLDRKGIVQYIQLVAEVTHEPDYEAVLNAVKKLL